MWCACIGRADAAVSLYPMSSTRRMRTLGGVGLRHLHLHRSRSQHLVCLVDRGSYPWRRISRGMPRRPWSTRCGTPAVPVKSFLAYLLTNSFYVRRMPDERRLAPAHRMNSAPQWLSSHFRQQRISVLFGLKNFRCSTGLCYTASNHNVVGPAIHACWAVLDFPRRRRARCCRT